MRTRLTRFSGVLGLAALMLAMMLATLWEGELPTERAHGAGTAVTFVSSSGPITGSVRVLCYQTPVGSPIADRLLTVISGTPLEPLPGGCNYLAALYHRHEQPSGKSGHGPAFDVYTVSWAPGETTPLTATGTILISDDWRLTLFNVVASLAWEPPPGTAVLTEADMLASLRDTSAYLYDLTEGQMAIGPVTIRTGGAGWDDADIRVLPANDERPSAFVGGIAEKPFTYTSEASNSTLYGPAGIYLGRAWNAARSPVAPGDGSWTVTPTGTQTIAHEWGHYALFLYDEYQQTSGARAYCICNTLPNGCGLGDLDASAMAYPYTAGELWHQATHLAQTDFSVCQDTWNWAFHGNTDWKVVANWGGIQELPVQPIVFPTTLAKQTAVGLSGDLFASQPGFAAFLPVVSGGTSSSLPPEEPEIEIFTEALPYLTGTVSAQVYVLEGGADSPSRILPYGLARSEFAGDRLGFITLPGINQADRGRIFVERYDTGARFSYPEQPGSDSDLFDGLQVYADQQAWNYELDHRFEVANGRVTTLTVSLSATLGLPPTAQLCAMDAATGCHSDWKQKLSFVSPYWQAVFTPLAGADELPRYLVLRVQAPDIGFKGEAIQELRVHGGVGPAHGDGIAPLADGVVMLNTTEEVVGPGDCHIASYAPARSSEALAAPLPPGIGGIIGYPRLIRISLPFDICPTLVPGQNAGFAQNVIINIGYMQSDLSQLGVSESNLVLLHFDPVTGWFVGQTIDINQELNWVAGSIAEDGIYALGFFP